MVGKLWGYLVGCDAPAGTARALQRAYVAGGYEVRPVVEAILRHPLFYDGPRMVTPPVVYCAGLLRATGQTITTDSWAWIGQEAGQLLFDPPNVAGWDYADWLDTARWSGRLTAVNYALMNITIDPDRTDYPKDETPAQAVSSALQFWGNPALSQQTVGSLVEFSARAENGITADWEAIPYRIMRQNALRALIPTTPEWQTS